MIGLVLQIYLQVQLGLLTKIKFLKNIDTKLLENLDAVRKLLVEDFLNKNIESSDALETANALIGRLLFVRYLIDRKVKIHFGDYSNEGYLSADDLNKILESQEETYKLFYHLKDKSRYNGDLFPFTKLEENQNFNVNFSLLIRLFKGDDIGKNQSSLFPYYDFSVIPVEFISNVYEQFIGVDNQRKQGAYYTPVFLVDYILNKTVKKHLKETESAICPVLDPACGSGIFLVETLRNLIQKYQALNPKYEKNTEGYHHDLIQLVKENIFGVDKDLKALHVAIFSIYITLLDNQNPADVEKFHFPKLLKTNFFEADFFKIDLDFDKILRGKKFRFILGNPPWGNLSKDNTNYIGYCKSNNIPIGSNEIAQAFMVRVGEFVSTDTDIALIVTSKVLYNLKSKGFRQYFLKQYNLDHILELSSVRDAVFDKVVSGSKKAIAPASILFYRKANEGEDTSQNLVLHIGVKPNIFFKIFKTLVIEKRDVQRVRQELFLKYDWLFKVLVYGNILDFYLIERLKKQFKTIKDYSKDEDFFKRGIIIGERNDEIYPHLINRPFVDSDKKMLKPFYCQIDEKYVWKETKAARRRDASIFEPPYVLNKSGLSNTLSLTAAYTDTAVVFTHSISVLKSDDTTFLKNALGYLSSTFFSYFILNTGSSAGIEREYAGEEEKGMLPYIHNQAIVNLVTEIEAVKKEFYNLNSLNSNEIEAKDNALMNSLNQKVLEAYNLNEEEKALVDYALNVSIPIWRNFESARAILKIQEQQAKEELSRYAQVFYDFFKPRFSNNFGVEIYYSKISIAMRFYHTYETIEQPFVFNQESHIFNQIFKTIGLEKVSQDFYIQKDIRGFDKNSFYIIKPNERKCWHPAVAYLDAYEFGQELDESKNNLQ
jgi:N-6 DNA Methylase